MSQIPTKFIVVYYTVISFLNPCCHVLTNNRRQNFPKKLQIVSASVLFKTLIGPFEVIQLFYRMLRVAVELGIYEHERSAKLYSATLDNYTTTFYTGVKEHVEMATCVHTFD